MRGSVAWWVMVAGERTDITHNLCQYIDIMGSLFIINLSGAGLIITLTKLFHFRTSGGDYKLHNLSFPRHHKQDFYFKFNILSFPSHALAPVHATIHSWKCWYLEICKPYVTRVSEARLARAQLQLNWNLGQFVDNEACHFSDLLEILNFILNKAG